MKLTQFIPEIKIQPIKNSELRKYIINNKNIIVKELWANPTTQELFITKGKINSNEHDRVIWDVDGYDSAVEFSQDDGHYMTGGFRLEINPKIFYSYYSKDDGNSNN